MGSRRGMSVLKIAAGIAAIVILVGAGAFFGWRHTTGLSQGVTALRGDLEAAVRLARVENSMWQLRWDLVQFLAVGPEERQRILAREPRRFEDIQQQMAAYTASQLSPEEREALADWNEQFAKYAEARPRWFQLELEGKTREAAEWRARTTTLGAASIAALDRLITIEQQVAAKETQAVLATSRESLLILAALLALTLVLGIGVVSVIARLGRKTTQLQLARDDAQQASRVKSEL